MRHSGFRRAEGTARQGLPRLLQESLAGNRDGSLWGAWALCLFAGVGRTFSVAGGDVRTYAAVWIRFRRMDDLYIRDRGLIPRGEGQPKPLTTRNTEGTEEAPRKFLFCFLCSAHSAISVVSIS